MKFHMLFLSIISTLTLQAQEFKPYKIKSGKITYEKLKYSTVSGYSNKNGVETGYSKQVPYIAEQQIYYWDEFGDVAFQETYQISKFGGKLLPKKVKISEQLWVDEDRYYFNFEENKVSKDPYHLRIKCKQHFQYYQITDSWIETLYMGTEKSGTIEIVGKQANYYNIDTYQDLYAWKGLVLKDESFATTPKGERLHLDRARLAVEIDTTFSVNKDMFNPIWLVREELYKSFNENKIIEFVDARPDTWRQADNKKGMKLQKNDILLFVTTKLVMGKMQVLAIDKNNQLIIKYELYNNYSLVDSNNSFKIKNNTTVNIDSPFEKNNDSKDLDFKWNVTSKAMLYPLNNISILLLKASRTKTLEIQQYRRKH